jgi:hypothetical protein
MKLKFKFLPTMVGDWLFEKPYTGTKIRTCIVFPCCSCINYMRGKSLYLDDYIINVNDGHITSEVKDECLVKGGFINISYDETGKPFCNEYLNDSKICRKL